ncbi:MAG: SWIB/MDM2 domain-containing protein [Myxococcota bacterium]
MSPKKNDDAETPQLIPYPTNLEPALVAKQVERDDDEESDEDEDQEQDDGDDAADSGRTVSFLQPMTPSAELARVVGPEPKTRVEVVQRLWSYIKQHRLQDQEDKKMIKADENLRAVFGGQDRVSMFEMTSLVMQHLT